MTAHSLLIVCSLLGQAAAPQSTASPGVEGKAADRYTEGRYTEGRFGDGAIPRRTAANTDADLRKENRGDAVQQPSRSIGARFLQDEAAERNRYGSPVGDRVVNASDGEEELPVPRSATVPPVRNDATPPATGRNPITPAAEPPQRTTIPPAKSPPTPLPGDAGLSGDAGLPGDTRPGITAEASPPAAAPKSAAEGNALRSDEIPIPSRQPPTAQTPSELPPRRIADGAVEALTAAFALPDASQLPGAPLTLSDALARRSDRDSRLAIAHAYWKVSVATAAYAFAVDEQRRLASLVQSAAAAPDVDRRLLDSALASAEARVHETKLVVVSSQHDLAEAIGGAAGETLPLASDPPFLGAYATRFDEIFADRAAPTQLRAIHNTLPTLFKAIGRRAEAATTASDAYTRAEQLYARGQLGIDTLLSAFDRTSDQRQAFLAVARAYNDDIADYAINVARDGTAAAELTSMLIRVPNSSSDDAARRGTRPVARSAQNTPRAVPADRSQPAAVRVGGAASGADARWLPKQ